ncbi:MAG: hypothetical protein ABOK23_08065 [Candidatus Methanoperedens sp.]|nr:hypothetical protein [Candidatus Methanoperedens sp.]MCZ7396320.1 hypothetical protein [Candidatus Methanoperedens sp.]
MVDLIFLQKIIEIYSWTAAGVIMICIAAIANFYQKKFGVRTFYYFFTVPVIVLLAAAVHIFSYNTFLSESIEFLGSATSFIASFSLYRIMVGVKK